MQFKDIWKEKKDGADGDIIYADDPEKGGINQLAEAVLLLEESAVSLKALGAAGDGITDDTEAVRQAFSGIYPSIIIPPGAYLISEGITIASNIYVTGVGEASKILLKAGSGDIVTTEDPQPHRKIFMFYADGASNVTLNNFQIDANREGYDANAEGLEVCSRADHTVAIELHNVSKLRLDGMTIRGGLIEGMYCYRGKDIKISNCTFRDNGYPKEDASGLHFDYKSQDAAVSGSIFEGNGFHGIIFTDAFDISICGCVCKNNGYDGILLQSDTRKVELANVIAHGNGRGGITLMKGAHDIAVSNCTASQNVLAGIVLYEQSNLFLQNLMLHNNEYGIYLGDINHLAYGQSVIFSGNMSRVKTRYENIVPRLYIDNPVSEVVIPTQTPSLLPLTQGTYYHGQFEDWGNTYCYTPATIALKEGTDYSIDSGGLNIWLTFFNAEGTFASGGIYADEGLQSQMIFTAPAGAQFTRVCVEGENGGNDVITISSLTLYEYGSWIKKEYYTKPEMDEVLSALNGRIAALEGTGV